MITDDFGDGARMFHGLRFDRHVFPLSITEVCRETTTWRERERLMW